MVMSLWPAFLAISDMKCTHAHCERPSVDSAIIFSKLNDPRITSWQYMTALLLGLLVFFTRYVQGDTEKSWPTATVSKKRQTFCTVRLQLVGRYLQDLIAILSKTLLDCWKSIRISIQRIFGKRMPVTYLWYDIWWPGVFVPFFRTYIGVA